MSALIANKDIATKLLVMAVFEGQIKTRPPFVSADNFGHENPALDDSLGQPVVLRGNSLIQGMYLGQQEYLGQRHWYVISFTHGSKDINVAYVYDNLGDLKQQWKAVNYEH